MTSTSAVRRPFTEVLVEEGFTRRGTVLYLKGVDVTWVVSFSSHPTRGVRDVEIQLLPRRTDEIPDLDSFRFVYFVSKRSRTRAERLLFDPISDYPRDEREDKLRRLAKDMAELMKSLPTLADVGRAYRAGEFEGGAIFKDMQALLEKS